MLDARIVAYGYLQNRLGCRAKEVLTPNSQVGINKPPQKLRQAEQLTATG